MPDLCRQNLGPFPSFHVQGEAATRQSPGGTPGDPPARCSRPPPLPGTLAHARALFIVADKASLLPTATNTRTCSMRSASPSKASPHKLASPRKPRTTRKAAKEAREGTPSALRLSKHTTRSASSSNASPHKLASPCKPRTTRKAVKEAREGIPSALRLSKHSMRSASSSTPRALPLRARPHLTN
ncbi:uncharacterized protein J3D65DRAFT_145569 [Phyllosticta citribraziliensis]|uniref:Uncharacterized protein n=1 Tax=Phyllosticta citribraziliensis TaxID=989973 RepID=A0ABR1L8J6_9PEZI